ncbi:MULTISPECIES: hypothetical protein [unclassified Variovorax]|uniref:hypothetical protein n=1 Tax=unclassified Variovorax TaxID=663243 RepID=UPI0011602976|nr:MULTISPECIES: hypothetical protein [unclassified Variovorax]
MDAKNCRYRVEPTEKPGFALEVFYREYRFLRSPEKPIHTAKPCFVHTAERLAQKKAKKLKPIFLADINAAPTRNSVDGTYAGRAFIS